MSVLSIILDHKRTEVETCKKRMVVEAMTRPTLPGLDFVTALRRPGISVIAEVKRKSPSRGFISQRANVADIAASYRRGGASALSVLTDHRFFGAVADDLAIAKRAASLPVLRKDFIIDPYQIHESVHLGADAVLLIVAALTDGRLQELTELTREVGLQALVEVHSESELERALVGGATIIGVNSRDLATLAVDPDICPRLRHLIPSNCLTVAESGIRSPDDVIRLTDAGYDAILVGEALMEATDPARRLEDLTGGAPEMRESGRLKSDSEDRA